MRRTLECPRCSISLTYHAARGRLRCHTCDFERRPPAAVPGVPRVRLRIPGIRDPATRGRRARALPQGARRPHGPGHGRNWRAAERILHRLTQGEIDILVGTQMIGKGHDVPNVTLVGVVSADMALHLPDFRAGERAFALFTQVVGRAGRGKRPGLALIQTFNPDHYILRAVQAQDYATMWEAESPLRRDRVLAALFPRRPGDAEQPAGEGAEAAATELARLLPRGRDARRCRERARARPALPPALALPMAPAGARTGSSESSTPASKKQPAGCAPPPSSAASGWTWTWTRRRCADPGTRKEKHA